MKSRGASVVLLAVLACAFASASAGQGRNYTFTSFFYQGSTQTYALGIMLQYSQFFRCHASGQHSLERSSASCQRGSAER